jgi:hypothetical protein
MTDFVDFEKLKIGGGEVLKMGLNPYKVIGNEKYYFVKTASELDPRTQDKLNEMGGIPDWANNLLIISPVGACLRFVT